MSPAESIIQDLYKNRASLPKRNVAYIENGSDDPYPITIIMKDNYKEAKIDDFRFSFSDMTDHINFEQTGPVPNEKFNTFMDMVPEVKDVIEDYIGKTKSKNDYEKEVFESIPTGDEEIDERVPTEEEEKALTYTPDLSEIKLGQELQEDYEQEFAESKEQEKSNETIQESNQKENDAEKQAEKEPEDVEELEGAEDLTEEDHERIIAEAKVNRTQEENIHENEQEETLETEEDLEEIDEEAERLEQIKKDKNRLDSEDSGREAVDKIISQYDEGMEDVDLTLPNGKKVVIENETPTNPKILDNDNLPGIIVKIDGRRVTRKEFEEFIKDNKEDFVRAYNEVYDKRIKEKESTEKSENRENQTEKQQKTQSQNDKTNNERKFPTYRDVGRGDPDRGKETLSDIFSSYSDFTWKEADIKMDNGDKIHVEQEMKKDQQVNPYRRKYMMNGKEASGRDFYIFARYVDLNKEEMSEKFKEVLDHKRAERAKRNEEMDR